MSDGIFFQKGQGPLLPLYFLVVNSSAVIYSGNILNQGPNTKLKPFIMKYSFPITLANYKHVIFRPTCTHFPQSFSCKKI